MSKILVVDDEMGIRDIIKQYIEFEGHECDEASNGREAVNKAMANQYDLIIMDVMMPFLDGIAALIEIRKKCSMPIIMLTAKGEEYDKILGFELGADDYVVKPFSPKELMARVKAVLKRSGSLTAQNVNTYSYKGIEINFASYDVKIDNKKLSITLKEFELLHMFVKNKGIVLKREEILSEIWGYDVMGDSRTVDTHVKMLRNNLGDYRDLIKTVWGVGYRYDEN